MGKSSRRKFVKQAAVATAAIGSLEISSKRDVDGNTKSVTVDVLYRETSEWKKYYETLK